MIIPEMKDRELTVVPTTGEPLLVFNKCGHTKSLSRHTLYSFSNERQLEIYLTSLRCEGCEWLLANRIGD